MASVEMSRGGKYYQCAAEESDGGDGIELEARSNCDGGKSSDQVCLDTPTNTLLTDQQPSLKRVRTPGGGRPPLTLLEATALCVPDNTLVLDGFFPCAVDESLHAYTFPRKIDAFFAKFDDSIIDVVQRPLANRCIGSSLVLFARVISAVLTSSEIGFAIPTFILLLERFDTLAIISTYEFLLLAMLPQILKRFVYRARPFCTNRATGVVIGNGPATSSFPSRAVTTAMVYACFIGYIRDTTFKVISGGGEVFITTITNNQVVADESNLNDGTSSSLVLAYEIGLPWSPHTLSTWLCIVVFVLIVSWARVFLGCHYPSCCVSGMFLGLLIHFLSVFIARSHFNGCSCLLPQTWDETSSNISSKSGYVVGFGVPLAALLELGLGLSEFWDKSTHALGLLLPSLIFILAFLCPKLSGHSELHVASGVPDATNIVTAALTTVFLSMIGFITQWKHPLTQSDYFRFTAFLFLMVISLMALVATRLIQREEDKNDQLEGEI